MIDSIFVTFSEGDSKHVVFRVCKDGGPEYDIVVPLALARTKELFKELNDNPGVQRKGADYATQTCPACGSRRGTFLRKYGKYYFCGFCGSHLRLHEDKTLEIIARTNG